MDKLVEDKDSTKVFEKYTYTWHLNNFTELSKLHATGSCVYSPTFPEQERKHKWYLALYPNGVIEECGDYLSLFLRPATKINNTISVTYRFYLFKSNDAILKKKKYDAVFKVYEIGRGFRKFFSREELISSISDDDTIKIRVSISAEVLELKSYHALNPPKKLSRQFGSILQNKEFSDFVIKFGDGSSEIPVHGNILAARSPVFRAMFLTDASEKKLGYTEIIDVSKDTMSVLLEFVYTGQLKILSTEETKKLLIAADKYGIEELKQSCSEILANELLISNAMGIFVLADICRVPELKLSAFNYILENASKFGDVSMYAKMKKYPDLLIELITKMSQLKLT